MILITVNHRITWIQRLTVALAMVVMAMGGNSHANSPDTEQTNSNAFNKRSVTAKSPDMKQTLAALYTDVAALKLGKNGYHLAAPLTNVQKKVAENHLMDPTTQGTYRFRDPSAGGLIVVADSATHRVLLMMEQVEHATRKTVQNQVGGLFMEFGEPTLLAHDRIVYWAYGKTGKYTMQAFEESKERQQPLPIIATIKLQSELAITAPAGDNAKNRSEAMKQTKTDAVEQTETEALELPEKPGGQLYLVMTSEAVLKHFVQ